LLCLSARHLKQEIRYKVTTKSCFSDDPSPLEVSRLVFEAFDSGIECLNRFDSSMPFLISRVALFLDFSGNSQLVVERNLIGCKFLSYSAFC